MFAPGFIVDQVRHFERKVCEAYAHNECYGTGTIWVCFYFIFNYCEFVTKECVVCGNSEHCTEMFPSIFQVPKNDVWKDLRSNGFMDNFDESAYNFVKAKAVEALAELLEKRTNANGLVILIIGQD